MAVTWSDNANIVEMTAQSDTITLRNDIKFVHVYKEGATIGTDKFDLTETTSGVSVARAIAGQSGFDVIVPVADGPVGPLTLTTLTSGVVITIHLEEM